MITTGYPQLDSLENFQAIEVKGNEKTWRRFRETQEDGNEVLYLRIQVAQP